MSYNFLVVIDGSDRSLSAVKEVTELSKGISQAVIHLLYVYPVHLTSQSMRSHKDYLSVIKREAEEALSASVAYLELHGVPFEKTIRIGNPIQEISLNVRMFDCKMVVLSHTSNPSHLGLVDTVIKKACCPVLVVPDKYPTQGV